MHYTATIVFMKRKEKIKKFHKGHFLGLVILCWGKKSQNFRIKIYQNFDGMQKWKWNAKNPMSNVQKVPSAIFCLSGFYDVQSS